MAKYIVYISQAVPVEADSFDAAIDWALDTSSLTSDWVDGVDCVDG